MRFCEEKGATGGRGRCIGTQKWIDFNKEIEKMYAREMLGVGNISVSLCGEAYLLS